MASPILSDAVPVLHDEEHFGNKIGGAILEGNKLGTTATEAGHLFYKDDFIHFINESGVEIPSHDNSLTDIDVADDSPLTVTTNGRKVELDIALATALKAGILSAEHYALLAGATANNNPNTIVMRGAGGSGGSTSLGDAIVGSLDADRIFTSSITGLSSSYSADSDAASQGFVNNLIQDLNIAVGGRDFKDSVRLAFTTNLPLNARPPAQGGVTVANGESVLLLGQTDASQNGAYTWNGSNLVRRADSNGANLTAGATYYVEAGDLASYHYTLATSDFTLDTDPLTFLDASDVALAGDGLVKEGRIIHARGVTDEIAITADAIGIAPAYTAATEQKIATAIAPLQDETEVQNLISTALESYGAVGERIFTFGDGVATEFTCTHNAGQRYPVVQGYYQGRKFEVNIISSSTTSFTFTASLGGTPVAADSITIVVHTDPAAANTSPSGEWIIAG